MTARVVNIRQPIPRLGFGDPDAVQDWEAEAERVRAEAARRGFSYVVSPQCTVHASDGATLQAGDEVQLSHFEDIARPAWRTLRRLVDEGRILEVYSTTTPDDAA